MKIALDAFGSDNAPFPEIEGAVLSIKENICQKIFLVGNKDILVNGLAKYHYPKDRIEIIHAEEVITMEDDASSSARKKLESSMVKTLSLHKDGIADASLSVGNTGAVMAASLFTLGRIKNIYRPAIAITLPTVIGHAVVLDAGANVDCEPEYLNQFAVIGNLYSKFLFKKETPRVSLLNIGGESKKGNELTKKAYNLLKENPKINFVGNIEGKGLLAGLSDVVVCDGFSGNIMLKTVEGTTQAIFNMIKAQVKKNIFTKIGAIFISPVFKYLRKKLDDSEYGGALLVGLNGVSVVGHGSSNAIAIKNAVRFTCKIASSDLIQQFKDYFEEIK